MKDVQLRGLWTLVLLVIFSFALVAVRTSFDDLGGRREDAIFFLEDHEIATL